MRRWVKYLVFGVAVALMAGVFVVRMSHEETDPNAVPHIDMATNSAGTVNVTDLKGRWVLVDFWDSHNAVSRIAAGEYDRWVRRHPEANLKLVSINTDNDPKLYREIVDHDGLDGRTQYHVSDTKASGKAPDFKPAEGYASYLLDPQGRLIAVNPTVGSLEEIFGRR